MGQAVIEKKEVSVPSYAWVILAVAFMASVAAPLTQFKVAPIMPVLMEVFKLSPTQAGMLMSMFAITGFVLALPAGLILQRVGLKITGMIAMGFLIVGALMGIFSSTAGLMFTSRVVEGAGMALIAVVAPASIGMWFPREKQGTPMGLWATWVPVGSVLMFLIAPPLATSFGWKSVWWFSLIFSLVAFVLVWLFMKMPPHMTAAPEGAGGPPPGEAPSMGEALKNRNIWLLAGLFGLFNMALIAVSTFYPTYLSAVQGYSMTSASWTASITMIVVIFAAPLAGILSDKMGSRKTFLTWPFIVVAVMFLFPFTVTGVMIALWLALMGVIAGAIPTATFAATPEIMKKPALVGMGMAVVAVGQNLGMFIGPMMFGALVESSGWAVAGYAMIPVLLLGFVLGWLIKVR
jgi:nitrate/nitrite transporter NarK